MSAKNKPKEPKRVSSSNDYYLDDNGFVVFEQAFLLKRGFCCKTGCTHCPYGYQKEEKKTG